MKLECYLDDGIELDIRPSSAPRDWMDATGDRFAYRCLPLSIANAHGWTLHCGGGFEAVWSGGNDPTDVRVVAAGDGSPEARGHFGYGILTIAPLAVFRTEPGYNLWVTGSPNAFKEGIQPLSAVVETDWMPYHFTMNWKFTRPDVPVRFAKGEPYCFVFPVKRGSVEEFAPVLKRLSDAPEVSRQVATANEMRAFLATVKRMQAKEGRDAEIENEKMLKFQKWYMQGKLPDGSSTFEAHQRSLHVRPFEDLRAEPRGGEP